jgi:flagellar hook protein FlgE
VTGAVPVTGGIVYATGSTTPQPLTLNFLSTTQFGATFAVNQLAQNGYTSGQLSGFSTSSDGTIMGRYTNGQSKALGQVLIANFANPQGLQPVGNNEWSSSASSGPALLGTPGSSSLGVLQSGAVEDSNVDLTAELVNMIQAQRVYQANAQTIKTQDALLQTITNLR